jgi:hypothetical protein
VQVAGYEVDVVRSVQRTVTTRSAWSALIVSTLFASGMATSATAELAHPAPQRRKPSRAAKTPWTNQECSRCHAEIASEWQGSRHRASYENAEFLRSVDREKPEARGFCVGCHAPEMRGNTVSTAARAAGVGCVTCHVPEGSILAAARSDAPSPERAPHTLTRSAAFASPAACASCHEFRFFDARHGATDENVQFMQRTLSEHRDGSLEVTACASCHMPRIGAGEGRHRAHSFPGGHSAAFVRNALSVRAERRTPTSVTLTLTPQNVTHAVPTGDLFRRLALTARATARDGSDLVAERFLARHHERRDRGQRLEVRDDRPHLMPRVVTLELGPSAADRPIEYSVVYQRVDHLVGDDERKAVVAGEIVIDQGAR